MPARDGLGSGTAAGARSHSIPRRPSSRRKFHRAALVTGAGGLA